MQTVSVVILTKNEEQNIGKCIKSVAWCDEIIVVDDNSTDKTIEVAKKHKVTLYSRSLQNDFASQRNFGISKAKGDWILFVDADEIVPDALAYEISHVIQLKNQNLRDYSGFYIKREYFIWGKKLKYGETADEWRLRLARKMEGQWVGKVHERWDVKGLIGRLVNPLLHFPHQTLDEFLREVNFYTDIRAGELNSRGNRVFFWSIFLYPLGKFVINYLIKRGYMNGVRGLIFAVTMSFHSFLVRGKLWVMSNKR